MPHLVVSISGHGYGHVAQTAPILNALHTLLPELQLTVRSTVPLDFLRSRIRAPFSHLPSHGDIGLMMSSALDIDIEKSRAAYHVFHADWETRVAAEAIVLQDLRADLVFSNVGYLPLAGAQQAGIKNVALCSLNWYDIYRHYCIAPSANIEPTTDERIAAQIHAAYANADAFLCTTPGMEMASFSNRICIPPIAELGRNRRDEINQKLHLAHDEKLVLISMGGIATRLPMEAWPPIAGVHYLVQASWQIQLDDAIVLESLNMPFADVLASCDVLLCKPGYGSFAEAGCGGVPVLYVDRGDWPEAPALTAWLQQHGVCREITRHELECGQLAAPLAALCHAPRRATATADGATHSAHWLADHLASP